MRALLTILLVVVSAVALFVPVTAGAGDVKAMFVLLTGIAVRDYFAHRQEQEKAEGPPLADPVVNE